MAQAWRKGPQNCRIAACLLTERPILTWRNYWTKKAKRKYLLNSTGMWATFHLFNAPILLPFLLVKFVEKFQQNFQVWKETISLFNLDLSGWQRINCLFLSLKTRPQWVSYTFWCAIERQFSCSVSYGPQINNMTVVEGFFLWYFRKRIPCGITRDSNTTYNLSD